MQVFTGKYDKILDHYTIKTYHHTNLYTEAKLYTVSISAYPISQWARKMESNMPKLFMPDFNPIWFTGGGNSPLRLSFLAHSMIFATPPNLLIFSTLIINRFWPKKNSIFFHQGGSGGPNFNFFTPVNLETDDFDLLSQF